MKGLIFYFKKFSQNESDSALKNLIKIITSIIQVINRMPSSIEYQDHDMFEIINTLIFEFIYNKFLNKALQKQPLPAITSLSGQLLMCIFEMLYVLSKITIYSICLIKTGLFLELLLFCLFFDKLLKKQKSEFVNQIAKKVRLLI